MVRENAFQVAMFSADTHRCINALYESYGQKFENLNEFKRYLQENTENYHFIWYDRKKGIYKKKKAPANVQLKKLKY